MHLTVCSCHVTCKFQSECTLCNCLSVKELLAQRRCKIWSLSNCNWTWTQNHLVGKLTLNHLAKRPNDWAVFWVLICMVHLTICSCHVTYVFQNISTLYSYLNVKEHLAQSRLKIWSLSDCNWTRTQNHLICKRTLNHLAKLAEWLTCILSTYPYGAFDCMFLSCHVCVSGNY